MDPNIIGALIGAGVSLATSLVVISVFFGGVSQRIKSLEKHIDQTVSRVEFQAFVARLDEVVSEIKGLRRDLMATIIHER